MKKQLAILVLSTALLAGCAGNCRKCDNVVDCDIVVKEKVVLSATSTFAFDSATLTPASKDGLDQIVARLKAAPNEKIRINGYTDSVGSASYNMELSRRRADAVKAYLVSQGINPARIVTHGYGASNPIASNATAEGRAENRRTEVLFYE